MAFTPFPEVDAILAEILSGARRALGDTLLGAYLHGSLASGDFNPRTSDIDLVAVTRSEVTQSQERALAELHDQVSASTNPYAQRVECSYIPRAALRRHDPADSRHPRLSAGGRLAPTKHTRIWSIERQILREHGVVLAGPPPRELIDAVSAAEIREAVVDVLRGFWARQLEDAQFLRTREYQAFGALTICRALHTLERGGLVSKPAASRWAQVTLGEPWAAIVARASDWPDGEQSVDGLEETRALIRYALARSESSGDEV